jgi:hypothetical protein
MRRGERHAAATRGDLRLPQLAGLDRNELEAPVHDQHATPPWINTIPPRAILHEQILTEDFIDRENRW